MGMGKLVLGPMQIHRLQAENCNFTVIGNNIKNKPKNITLKAVFGLPDHTVKTSVSHRFLAKALEEKTIKWIKFSSPKCFSTVLSSTLPY